MPLPPEPVGAFGHDSDVRPHLCDDTCVCPDDGLPLLYCPGTDEHACVNVECANGHGLPVGWRPIWEWPIYLRAVR